MINEELEKEIEYITYGKKAVKNWNDGWQGTKERCDDLGQKINTEIANIKKAIEEANNEEQ